MKKVVLHAQSKKLSEQAYQYAVVEIRCQCLFAMETFKNITKKGEGEKIMTFSSIHSFLTHCANISKILWSRPNPKYPGVTFKEVIGENVSDRLRIGGSSPIKDMEHRDGLDHYDERIVRWVKDALSRNGKKEIPIVDLTIGEKHFSDALYLRHYDPEAGLFTFIGKELNLKVLYDEVVRINGIVRGPTISINGLK